MSDRTELSTVDNQTLPSQEMDHPEGDAIRRQVEYYFSDENLVTDKHMLEKMNYNDNLPISINHILGFRKMRHYKPRSLVIEALRKSAFLNVTEDKKLVRKVPFMYEPPNEDEQDQEQIILEGGRPVILKKPMPEAQTDTQRTKQMQPTVSQSAKKATGFEEFYADTPLTPEQYLEEQGLYQESSDFEDRMDIAIYRYTTRRKFRSETKNMFDKFLKFGGIECLPRTFGGGITAKQLKEEGHDVEYIALHMGTHKCGDDKSIPGHWIIDFEATAKGFLSSEIFNTFDLQIDEVHEYAMIMTNFYNYLLYHSVCDEYTDDIEAAKRVCALARKELPAILEINISLPGDFNRALSTLSSGAVLNSFHMGTWDSAGAIDLTIPEEKARIIALTGLLACADDNVIDALSAPTWSQHLTCVGSETVELEVTGVELADEEVRQIYSEQQAVVGKKLALEAIGKLHCKPYRFPNFNTYDLPPGMDPYLAPSKELFTFHVEEAILQMFVVGMKFEAKVRKVKFANGACWEYLDESTKLRPTFHTVLLNELVRKPIVPRRGVDMKETEEQKPAVVEEEDDD